jgi:hypothetical protein
LPKFNIKTKNSEITGDRDLIEQLQMEVMQHRNIYHIKSKC